MYRFEKNFSIIRDNELHLIDVEFKRGHDIPCRFCGMTSSDHVSWEEINLEGNKSEPEPEWKKRLKGFRVALINCPQYVPKNVRDWERAEKQHQQETRDGYW